jgi:hypothetical protein
MGSGMEYATTDATVKQRHLILLAFLIAIPTISSCSATGKDGFVTVATLKSEFDNDLPVGTPMSAVEAYLAKKGIGSSGEIDNATMAHMGKDPSTYALKSIVRNVRKSAFVTTDISVSFTFGRDKLLQSIEVKEVHTGL